MQRAPIFKIRMSRLLAALLMTATAMSLTAFATPSRADTPRRLLDLPVPTDLANALARHYDIGRGAWDLGGISTVESYSLAAFAPLGAGTPEYLQAVVLAFVQSTDQGRADDLAETCGVVPDDGEFDPLTDPVACAAWHVQHPAQGDASLAHDLRRIRSRTSTDEALTYNQALDQLTSYLFGPQGETQYLEIRSAGADYGLDFYTILLVDAQHGVAHYVRYDRGN